MLIPKVTLSPLVKQIMKTHTSKGEKDAIKFGIENVYNTLKNFPLEPYGYKCAKITNVTTKEKNTVVRLDSRDRDIDLFAVPTEISAKLFKTKLGRTINKIFPKLAKGHNVHFDYTALDPTISYYANRIKQPSDWWDVIPVNKELYERCDQYLDPGVVQRNMQERLRHNLY